MLHDRLPNFLMTLELLDAAGRHDAFMNEVMETGGSLTSPQRNQSHLWEINLHGQVATGHTEEEAIRNWRRAASTCWHQNKIEHF